MAERGAYWQGIRLWEFFQKFSPWAQRTTDTLHQGVEQQYATRNADSPNFGRAIQIRTVVEADKEGKADVPDWMALLIQLLDVEKDLLALAIGTPQGHLAICYDVARKASVTGGPHAGAASVVSHSAAEAGWDRTVGRYVLARNPTTGEGFVAGIDAVDTVATDVTIDIPTGYSVTSAWMLVDVQVAFADCAYRGMDGGTPADWEEQGIPDVLYEFDCEADPLFATAYVASHDNG